MRPCLSYTNQGTWLGIYLPTPCIYPAMVVALIYLCPAREWLLGALIPRNFGLPCMQSSGRQSQMFAVSNICNLDENSEMIWVGPLHAYHSILLEKKKKSRNCLSCLKKALPTILHSSPSSHHLDLSTGLGFFFSPWAFKLVSSLGPVYLLSLCLECCSHVGFCLHSNFSLQFPWQRCLPGAPYLK